MAKTVDKLQRLRIFTTIIEEGSFHAAAEKLGLTPPSVSKALQLLESDLSATLILRTTRSLETTEAGQGYYTRARQLLNDLEDLDNETRQADGIPRGQLHVTAPVAFGEHVLGPIIPQFLKENPEVSLELDLSGDPKDLKKDGFDVAIRNNRAGGVEDYYYVPIRSLTPTLVASKEYVAEHGAPEHPNELTNHRFVLHRGGKRLFNKWVFSRHGGNKYQFKATSSYICNNIQNGIEAANQGLGIVNTYAFYVEAELKEGSLVRILPDFDQPDVERFAYYRQRRSTSAKLDAFLTFIEEKIGLDTDTAQ